MNKNIRERLLLAYENNKRSTFGLIAKELIVCYDTGIFLDSKELAQKCYVSKSMITYFCKKNSFKSYHELIILLKLDFENSKIFKNQSPLESDKLLDNLTYLNNSFEEQTLNIKNFANKISTKKNIIIFSSYTNFEISKEFCDFLLNIGINAIISNNFYSLNNLINKILISEDVMFLFIVSGPNNKLLVECWNELINKYKENMFLICSEASFKKFNALENNFIVLKTFSSNIKQDKLFYIYRTWSLTTLFIKISYFLLN